MHSTLKPKPTDDPHDFVLVAPDVVRVVPADADEELSILLKEAARRSSNPQTSTGPDFSAGPPVPPVDTTFRPAAVDNLKIPGERRSIGKSAVRAVAALLLAACVGVAAITWQSSGNVAKQIIGRWAPKFILTSLLLEKPGLPAQLSTPTVQVDAANTAPPQPAPQAQTAPEGVAPATAAALSPGEPQLLQSIARDLATAGQEIEQLKASIQQLKASQEQMSRDIAKTPVQNLRPRIAAPPPKSAAAPARKPMPALPLPQAAAAPTSSQAAAPPVPQQPEPQPQTTAQPQDEPVLRPPLPLR